MNIDKIYKYSDKIHFIGIGGISMSALANFVLSDNKKVSGSDKQDSGLIKSLALHGANITVNKFNKSVKNSDMVIYSSAIKPSDKELKTAKRKGIPLIKRSELLGYFMSCYKNSIAISGSHGKTTCTSMLSDMLIAANLNPTVFIGGEKDYGNFKKGNSEYAICEACEYRKNFLDIKPRIAIVLNIDNDHLESYHNSLTEEISCFNNFISDCIAIVNADDINSKALHNNSMLTFGIKNNANFRAKNIRNTKTGLSFSFYAYGIKQCRIKLNLFGIHNIYNALASLSVCSVLKLPLSPSVKALSEYRNVKRRNEYLGKINGKNVYADYAHHPTEVNAMIDLYNTIDKDTLFIFQPHTYSRTKLLKTEFVSCLKKAERLIIYKTYPAREKYDENGSAKALFLALNNKKCKYADSIKKLNRLILSEKERKNIIFIGAGNIYDIAKKLISVNGCKNR